MSLEQVGALSNVEIEHWRAYYAVKRQAQQLEDMKARGR